MIKIDTTQSMNVQDFLNQYQIWIDHYSLYNEPKAPVVTGSDHGWPCFEYDDINGINNCQSPQIVICCITEGIHSKKFFDQYRSDHKYLIISNGWWDRDHYRFNYQYELVHYPFFLLDMTATYLSPHKFCFYSDNNYDFKYPKSKIWISTIGSVRPERTILVDKLRTVLSYNNYVLRYSGQDHGEPCDADIIGFEAGKFDPYTHILPKYYHNVSQSLPLKIYNQGYFNLVVESDITYQKEFFLTEKTVKCLISGMPFVTVSTPRFLHHLRNMGFETYHDQWDESYDETEDHVERINRIVTLCENLKTFDWHAHAQVLQLIAWKNRQNFFNLHTLSHSMFEQFERAVLSLDQ